MQPTYHLEFEARAQSTTEPSAAAVEAYYRDFCPQDGPPLADIRAHVVSALRLANAAPKANDTLNENAAALDLHLFATQSEDLALAGGGADVATFLSAHEAKWFDATRGAEVLEGLLRTIDAGAVGPRKRKLFAPEDVRQSLRAALEGARTLIADAAQVGRRFRFTSATQEVPLQRQLDVLASAGIRLQSGSAPKDLIYNYTESEITKEPFDRIFTDFTELSGDITELSMKCIEGAEDRDAYARLANAIVALSKGKLPLENVESQVDFDSRTASFRCTLDGQHKSVELRADTWADMRFFAFLGELLSARSKARLCIVAPDRCNDGALFACLGREARLRLQAAGIRLDIF